MAVYRIIGDHVIAEEDLRANPSMIGKFLPNPELPPALGGQIKPLGATTPFVPIGKGLPLTVLIRHVYTGQYPDPNVFGRNGDIAVVSGVRDFDVFNAASRALNFIQQSVPPCSHLTTPSAFTDGTPLVAYSPAVLADSITLTIELAAARFPQGFVKSLSGAFTALAGIPMLMPYAGWLLGSGQITKLAGDIGHALMDGPVFTKTEQLDFEWPGTEQAVADFRVISRPEFRADLFKYKDGRGLVDLDDQAYRGEQPYVIVSLDGRRNDKYAKFAPTLASAAVLERFFQVKEGQQAAIDTLIEGMRLASDLKYRQLAEGLAQEIAAAAGDAETIKSLTQQLKAVRDNIQTPALRPPMP
ncbi:hypothetical protein [Roseixanthobacter liquoris]|uniref:hypothetical protein n=1 Tax=Roseixanthobacter liquoris TaxID=3119921 RepID=UPI00372B136C